MSRRKVSLKRRLVSIAGGLILGYFVSNLISVWSAARSGFDGRGEAAIVLGAAQYNGEPSPVLQRRLDTAAELYSANKVALVVVTGGRQQGDTTTEAKTGYDYLAYTKEVDQSDIRLEVQGRSTYESLAATARFLKEEEITEVVVVTDPYHARRSQLIAGEVGLDADIAHTEASLGVGQVIKEAAVVSVGRLLGFRRTQNVIEAAR